MTETKRINLDLVDAIDITDDNTDETGHYLWIEVISFQGWDHPGFDEHQKKFHEQANAILDLLGCNEDSGGFSEGPSSCSVEAFKDL